jgi:hypothetical protein
MIEPKYKYTIRISGRPDLTFPNFTSAHDYCQAAWPEMWIASGCTGIMGSDKRWLHNWRQIIQGDRAVAILVQTRSTPAPEPIALVG